MEKMSELLGLFYSITKQMSHRYANSGDILPHIQVLRKYVTDEVTKFRLNELYAMLASLYDSFEGCFSSYENNINCIYASYLNPCYKYSIFEEEKMTQFKVLKIQKCHSLKNLLKWKKNQLKENKMKKALNNKMKIIQISRQKILTKKMILMGLYIRMLTYLLSTNLKHVMKDLQ